MPFSSQRGALAKGLYESLHLSLGFISGQWANLQNRGTGFILPLDPGWCWVLKGPLCVWDVFWNLPTRNTITLYCTGWENYTISPLPREVTTANSGRCCENESFGRAIIGDERRRAIGLRGGHGFRWDALSQRPVFNPYGGCLFKRDVTYICDNMIIWLFAFLFLTW
jgi:hypothetical protein